MTVENDIYVLMNEIFRYCGTGAMINLIKILKDLEAVSFKSPESASAEHSPDEGSLQSSDEGSDPRIQTLQIIINILDSEQNMGTFLTRSRFLCLFYLRVQFGDIWVSLKRPATFRLQILSKNMPI